MLTHVHKVIHKVVGTFARVLRGREKWRLPLPPADSAKKQRRKRSLEVTGRWPRGHLRVRSVQAEARTKELSERTLVAVHRRVRCIFAWQQTQGTGRSASASGANDVSAWLGDELIGHWGASNHTPLDVFGLTLRSLEPLCSTPDAAPARPMLLWQHENDFQ
jgi:hypothetical protein